MSTGSIVKGKGSGIVFMYLFRSSTLQQKKENFIPKEYRSKNCESCCWCGKGSSLYVSFPTDLGFINFEAGSRIQVKVSFPFPSLWLFKFPWDVNQTTFFLWNLRKRFCLFRSLSKVCSFLNIKHAIY